MTESSGGAPGIISRKCGDYDLLMLDDGTDYWAVARALLPALKGEGHRQVGIAEHGGRRYVIKRDATPVTYLECKLSRWWHGPVYSRVMRETTRAAAAGCDIVQRVYLVAERMRGGLATESLILLEFVPGQCLHEKDPLSFGPQVREAILTLHRFGLASMDPNPGNFITDGDRPLRVIDLSFRDSFAMGRAKDYVYLKDVYEVGLPDAGLLNRLLMLVVRTNRYLRYLSRRLRGRGDATPGLRKLRRRPPADPPTPPEE